LGRGIYFSDQVEFAMNWGAQSLLDT